MKREVRLYLAADHAGFDMKEKIKRYFDSKKISYMDLSEKYTKNDDYPDYAFAIGKRVSKNKNNKGILICGSGSGMSIAANKVKGIRAVSAYDEYSAKMSRIDNDTNILGLRGRNFPFSKIKKIVDIWLNTKFSNEERHKRRLRKIERYENEN